MQRSNRPVSGKWREAGSAEEKQGINRRRRNGVRERRSEINSSAFGILFLFLAQTALVTFVIILATACILRVNNKHCKVCLKRFIGSGMSHAPVPVYCVRLVHVSTLVVSHHRNIRDDCQTLWHCSEPTAATVLTTTVPSTDARSTG